MPFSQDDDSNPYLIDGTDADAAATSGYMQVADPGFFDTMQIPLLRGRNFASTDTATSEPVAIIDTALASKSFGTRNPVGSRIATHGLDGLHWRTIVGVVATVKRHKLSEGARSARTISPTQNPQRAFYASRSAPILPPATCPVPCVPPPPPSIPSSPSGT